MMLRGSDTAAPTRDVASSGGPQPTLALWLTPLIALLCWAPLAWQFLHRVDWVFSWDTAPYVEVANSLRAGRGIAMHPIFGLSTETWEPMRNWPPGYPVVIALLEVVGVPPLSAAPLVSVLAMACFLIVLSRFAVRSVGPRVALPLALVFAWMPVHLHFSVSALADGLYLTLAMLSVLCLARARRADVLLWRWLFVAGVLAGCAWSTRYAGLALLTASVAFLLLQLLWSRPLEVAKAFSAWMIGALLAAGPLLVRNLVVFGHANPFLRPTSPHSIRQVLTNDAFGVVRDLSTSWRFARGLVSVPSLAAIGLLAGILLWRTRRSWSIAGVVRQLAAYRVELLLVLLGGAHACMLLAARTRYSMDIQSSTARHYGQLYWLFWLLLARLATRPRSGAARISATRTWMAAAAFAVVAVLQLSSSMAELRASPATPAISETVDREVLRSLPSLRADQFVLTDRSYLVRLVSDIDARIEPDAPDCSVQPCFSMAEFLAAAATSRAWGVVITDSAGVSVGEYGPILQRILAHPDSFPTLRRLPRQGTTIVFQIPPRAERPAEVDQTGT